jgi:dGTPase
MASRNNLLKIFKNCNGCLSHRRLIKSVGRRFKDKSLESAAFSDPFLLDHNRIVNSKAFRRLKGKTQVFSIGNNPHVRTRLDHTMEVAALAEQLAIILGLNVTLCRAIAVGHDLGHVPYGHEGERTLSKLGAGKLLHSVVGVNVVQHIERKGDGLNLTYETLKGILLHRRGDSDLDFSENQVDEFQLVMVCDKIAYTLSDIEDAKRFEYFKNFKKADLLGRTQRERQMNCMAALVLECQNKGFVCFQDSKIAKLFMAIRREMFDRVYKNINETMQSLFIEILFDFLKKNPKFTLIDPVVFIALLTDREVDELVLKHRGAKRLLPEFFKGMGVMEIFKDLKGKKIKYWDADLAWKGL